MRSSIRGAEAAFGPAQNFGGPMSEPSTASDVSPMNLSISLRRPRRIRILVIVALAVVAIFAVPPVRERVLRAAGWALVVDESAAPADIIVVSLTSGGAGALEAADLLHSGSATQVAVFTDPPSGEDHEFIRRGLTRMRAQGSFAN